MLVTNCVALNFNYCHVDRFQFRHFADPLLIQRLHTVHRYLCALFAKKKIALLGIYFGKFKFLYLPISEKSEVRACPHT